MRKLKNLAISGTTLTFLLWLFIVVCWVVNLIKLFQCDFAAPYKDEVIHGIGLFVFFASPITVWF